MISNSQLGRSRNRSCEYLSHIINFSEDIADPRLSLGTLKVFKICHGVFVSMESQLWVLKTVVIVPLGLDR